MVDHDPDLVLFGFLDGILMEIKEPAGPDFCVSLENDILQHMF